MYPPVHDNIRHTEVSRKFEVLARDFISNYQHFELYGGRQKVYIAYKNDH